MVPNAGARHVVVVGGGLAGVCAALAARTAGARVTLIEGRAGASALSCGAYDTHGRAPVPDDVRALLASAGAPIVVGDASIVTAIGQVRVASARDVAVLDVPTSSEQILVPRFPVGTWDADAIAANVGNARAVDASLVHHVDEMRMPMADLARRHDDDQRLAFTIAGLKQVLSKNGGPCAAVLLPPCLGIEAGTIETLRRALPCPIGEALGEVGGAAALRFARWTSRALDSAGVVRVAGEARGIAAHGITMDDDRAVEGDAVILAIGGLIGGGTVYGSSEHEHGGELPSGTRAPLRLVVDVAVEPDAEPVVLWSDDAPMMVTSSQHGPDPELLFLGDEAIYRRAGLAIDRACNVLDRGGRPLAWLFAAGDLVAGRPRLAIEVIASGIRAGRAATL